MVMLEPLISLIVCSCLVAPAGPHDEHGLVHVRGVVEKIYKVLKEQILNHVLYICSVLVQSFQ